jgi:hypothetical protein
VITVTADTAGAEGDERRWLQFVDDLL